MIVGLLKEIKIDESRVALVPNDVKKLTNLGHIVLTETDCGKKSGFSDKQYIEAKAEVYNRNYIFKNADLIVKVKTPEGKEPKQFSKDQTLFSYLHYDGNESLKGAELMREEGVTAIAFEWVEEKGGEFPLLAPMSELTGIIGANKVIEIFRKKNKRILGNFCKHIKPARVMIIGLGTIGCNALNVFLHMGLRITLVDKHPETLSKRVLKYVPEYLWNRFKKNITIIKSDENNVNKTKEEIRKELPNINILFFAAVRRPSFKEKHLIEMDMLKLMKKNSVLIDAAANDRDLVETIVSYPEIDRVYNVNNVWHYANDHIPTISAYNASIILSNAILPYLLEIAGKGIEAAILENEALKKGTIIAGNNFTHQYTCNKRNLEYVPVEEIFLENINLLARSKAKQF